MRFAVLALGFLLLTGGAFLAVQKVLQPEEENAGIDRVDVIETQVARDAKGHRLLPPITGDGSFYDALLALESGVAEKSVTVLHLGDSHIAADGITQEIRRLLQSRFGDGGRGLMMPGFPFPGYHAGGVNFEKTGEWSAANSLTEDGAYGITGVSLSASSSDARLMLKAEKPFDRAVVSLLAGPDQGGAVIAQGEQRRTVDTQAAEKSVLRVPVPGGESLSISPEGNGKITVLGIAAEQEKPGIRYVNLGIPGASVLTTGRWDDRLMTQDLRALAPQLVVLGYGTNEGFQDELEVEAYRAAYEKFIEKIRQALPNATLLILGPMDGARLPEYARFEDAISLRCAALTPGEMDRYDEFLEGRSDALARWYPPPKLSEIREALKAAAQKQDALYLDLAEIMGGPCSIHRWALADPPLAQPDHVHLSDSGSERIAQAIFDKLMDGYRIYRNTPPAPTGVADERGAIPAEEPRQ